jgi:hypothetical protein
VGLPRAGDSGGAALAFVARLIRAPCKFVGSRLK